MNTARSRAIAFGIGFAYVAIATWPAPSWGRGLAPQVIGHRPDGCPRAFCGCGLARYLGLHDKRLNLAWNWARFYPHTTPHPGAAAVRRHHVMLLERHVEGTRWLVRDWNGGRHLAWEHVRDVRGYVFVQPPTRMGSL